HSPAPPIATVSLPDALPIYLLGGKGAGAAEMTRAGMPVPPGFTITTEACRAYYAHKAKLPQGLWAQVTSSIADLEKQSHKRFGEDRKSTRLNSSHVAISYAV